MGKTANPNDTDPHLPSRWASFTLVIALLILSACVGKKDSIQSRDQTSDPTFVGQQACVSCHPDAYRKWQGSHHDLAMDVATDSTVLGDFNDIEFEGEGMNARFFRRDDRFFVNTQGPDGAVTDFEVTHVFGVEPLQQYLIPFPGGRLQALSVAWDVDRRRWFHLYPGQNIAPDDWLHWTRAGQNWNGMCAECHSTNLQKNYDPVTRTFDTTWSEIDVSCEACHGPGSAHVEWAASDYSTAPDGRNGLVVPARGLEPEQQVELCAPCHSRRTQLGDYAHTRIGLFENDFVPAVLDEGLYHPDGQIREEVYVYGSFVQSKMYRNKIRCSDCHDVHSLNRLHDGNDLCLRCHKPEDFDTSNHHFHKKTIAGKPSDGALCVKCHMPEQPFMVIDWRADHSLRVPRPDLSDELDTPNACTQSGCHADKSNAWAADHYSRWYGVSRKPHYGETFHSARAGLPEARERLIGLVSDTLTTNIVRSTALALLRSYSGDGVTSTFERALRDESPLVRYTAVRHHSGSSPEDLVDRLSTHLTDSIRVIRGQAATRLAGVPAGVLSPDRKRALDRAVSEYEAAMAYSGDFAFAGHNLGNLYENLGQPEKAEASYRQAIEIDPRSDAPRMNLSVLYNRSGRNDEAEEQLRSVLETFPNHYEAAYSLGLLLAEMERYEDAIPFMELASEGIENPVRVFRNLGLVLQHLGKRSAAEETLQKGHEIAPGDIKTVHALAVFYIQEQRWSEAETYAQKLAVLMPGNPGPATMLRQILSQME